MRALGRPVLGYSNVSLDYRRRAEMLRGHPRLPYDCDGPVAEIEDFALPENLMIAIAIIESAGEVVVDTVAPGAAMTDLGAFAGCLEQARRLRDTGRIEPAA